RGPIDLEMFLGDCDFVEAVKRLTDATLLSEQRSPTAKDAAARRKRECEQYDAKQHAKAVWLWLRRRPATRSPVEIYLRGRGYVGTIPPTIAYLPARNQHPHAMISAIALPNEVEPGELGAPRILPSVHLT